MELIFAFVAFAVVALQLLSFADAQVDYTRTPGASGEAVVKATVNLIRQAESLQLPDDKELLSRIACVETRYGTDNDTYRKNYYGGIWQVDEDMFQRTQVIVMPNTRPATNIMREFQIDWHAITWEDLKKPLYSGLAARLFLSDIAEPIPLASDVQGQAKYWKTHYDLPSGPGTEKEFVECVFAHNDTCRVRGIDIVFLLDSSGSIGSGNFDLIKNFLTNVINGLEIGPDDTQVGVIKYSSSVSTEFHLNQYNSKSAVLQAISAISYTGGGTATHLGLQAVLEEFNTYSRPVGKGVPRVAFVLTDGRSNNFQSTIAKAGELHTANIEVYAVAIGDNVNEDELSAIATTAENVLNIDFDVTQLKELQEFIDREACEASVIALVGQDFNGTLADGETAYFEYGLPEEGLTVKVIVVQGIVTIYVSTIISNPNEALHDFKLVTSTTVSVFIPPKTPPNERKRRATDPSANDVVKVYIAIEGQSSSNRFTLNTTKDDTTPPEPLKIKFVKDSPLVSGSNMAAFIHSNKPVSDMTCRVSGTKEVKNCTNGYVQFTSLSGRNKYTLEVVAKTEEGETATIKRQFRTEQEGYCTVHLINEGVSINGDEVKVEFTPTGDTASTACILDPPQTEENKFLECSSPVTMRLASGKHLFKITPKGCGGKLRKPLKVNFEV